MSDAITKAFVDRQPCYLCGHARSRHNPGCGNADGKGGCMCSNYIPREPWDPFIPDYADIQRLEGMMWRASTPPTDYHEYAHWYHELSVKFTEDIVILCIEQYNRGVRW